MRTITTLLASASILGGLGLGAPAFADAAQQTILQTDVEPTLLATAWRATTLIGRDVYNDAGEEIGELEDLILTSGDAAPYAVISVGGFLGMGAHHVRVETASLEMVGDQLTLHHATEASLMEMPTYTFPAAATDADSTASAPDWRATQIIGADVYDEAGVEIGNVEDLILTRGDAVPYAVLSVGGVMGVGADRVLVATAALEMVSDQLTLPGASEDSLRALPAFTFESGFPDVDPTVLATGWRASEIIGRDVYNDAGEEIGQLEDLILTSANTAPYAVVSVGGFLGMGAHHVVVATSSFEMLGDELTLHGATELSLKALPHYSFES